MRKLLFSVTRKDLIIQTFRAGGKGGQNQNKRDTGVRIVHSASGAVGEARDERSQGQNKKLAFRRMTQDPKFKLWIKLRASLEAGVQDRIEEQVDRWMKEENLRIEVKENGRWVEFKS